jgi:hypothetical protein
MVARCGKRLTPSARDVSRPTQGHATTSGETLECSDLEGKPETACDCRAENEGGAESDESSNAEPGK